MPLSFNNERMDIPESRAGVGNNGALVNLPIAIYVSITQLVNTDGDAIKVEARQLTVGLRTEIRTAVDTERENIHQDRVVGVVDCIRERPRRHHRIDDGRAVTALDK